MTKTEARQLAARLIAEGEPVECVVVRFRAEQGGWHVHVRRLAGQT